MTSSLEFYLEDDGRLRFSTETGEWRETNHKEFEKLKSWISAYHHIVEHGSDRKELFKLGQEIYKWLDGPSGWMEKMKTQKPKVINFTVSDDPTEQDLCFLEVPWEIMADDTSFLAENQYQAFCPVRRIGKEASKKQPPSDYRLSALFMAASPRGETILNYEAEESAIILSTGNKGIDLIIEESGNLSQLAEGMATDHHPDVLHISCHGNNRPSPVLALETEEGDRDPVTPADFARLTGSNISRLLFLSACMTSDADLSNKTFASEMIRHGYPATLGWSGSVSDTEATEFSSELYGYLSRGESLESAVAMSRQLLLTRNKRNDDLKPSRDWHLARLYLGPDGGGKFRKPSGKSEHSAKPGF